MALVHKFEFDLSFDRNPLSGMGFAYDDNNEPPPPPTYSEQELEAARKLAWAEGHQSGEERAQQGFERRLSEAAARLADDFGNFAAGQQRVIADAERRAAEISLTLIRKIFPALLERGGTMEIEEILSQAFAQSGEELRMVVRCPEDLHADITALAQTVATRAGFDGTLAVIADPSRYEQDCRVEWAEGGIERAPRKMFEKIERAIVSGMESLDRRMGRITETSPEEEAQSARPSADLTQE